MRKGLRISSFALVVLGAVCAAQELPRFLNRELIPAPLVAERLRILSGESLPDGRVTPAVKAMIESAFVNVDPERSLLIRNCQMWGVWCDKAEVQAPAILGGLYQQWLPLVSAKEEVRQLQSLMQDGDRSKPFLPLALVNRLDAGQWNPRTKLWSGAEVRFVYGLRTPVLSAEPLPMTVIVEFVLAPLQWKDLKTTSIKWAQLAKPTLTPAEFHGFLSGLGNLVKTAERVRIRANVKGRDGRWRFYQWENVNAPSSMTAVALTDQVLPQCLGNPQRPECVRYEQVWRELDRTPKLPSYHPIVPGAEAGRQVVAQAQAVQAPTIDYSSTGASMPVPVGHCSDAGRAAAIRRMLALQQCTFCHGTETRTGFTHISNRRSMEHVARLSGFLAGKDGAKPTATLSELSNGAVHTAKINWGPCGGPPQTEERQFHDLARRRLFLATVLSAPANPASPGFAQFLGAMELYRPNFGAGVFTH